MTEFKRNTLLQKSYYFIHLRRLGEFKNPIHEFQKGTRLFTIIVFHLTFEGSPMKWLSAIVAQCSKLVTISKHFARTRVPCCIISAQASQQQLTRPWHCHQLFLRCAPTANQTYMKISRNFSSAEGQLRFVYCFCSNDSSKCTRARRARKSMNMFSQDSHCLGEITSDLHSATTIVSDGNAWWKKHYWQEYDE